MQNLLFWGFTSCLFLDFIIAAIYNNPITNFAIKEKTIYPITMCLNIYQQCLLETNHSSEENIALGKVFSPLVFQLLKLDLLQIFYADED
jgi:hypothetical protein